MRKPSEDRVKNGVFYEVWGDIVDLKELLLSCIIGVVISMGAYLIAKAIFMSNPNLEASMATGYALFAGLAGCVISCVVCSVLFHPKRVILEEETEVDILKVLEAEGINLEDELRELADAPADVLQEMRDNGLEQLVEMSKAKGGQK